MVSVNCTDALRKSSPLRSRNRIVGASSEQKKLWISRSLGFLLPNTSPRNVDCRQSLFLQSKQFFDLSYGRGIGAGVQQGLYGFFLRRRNLKLGRKVGPGLEDKTALGETWMRKRKAVGLRDHVSHHQ